eukprot:121066-Chlamydomonas_euryale.AAC.4
MGGQVRTRIGNLCPNPLARHHVHPTRRQGSRTHTQRAIAQRGASTAIQPRLSPPRRCTLSLPSGLLTCRLSCANSAAMSAAACADALGGVQSAIAAAAAVPCGGAGQPPGAAAGGC